MKGSCLRGSIHRYSTATGLATLALLVGVVGALLFSATGRGTWVVDPDSAAYVGLARSLADGAGYTFAGEPHTKFPPGFPAWLSLAIRWTGDPECYGTMRDLVTGAALLAILLVFPLGIRLLDLDRKRALVLTLLTGTSVFLTGYAISFLRSESLFMALFLASLVAGERWRRGGGARWALATGALCGVATLVRIAGVTATAALLIARALRVRPFRIALGRAVLGECLLFLVVAAAPPALFAARNASIAPGPGGAGGYGDELFAAYPLDVTKDVDVTMPRIDVAGMLDRIAGNAAVLALSLGKFAANDPKGANLAVVPSGARDLAFVPTGFVLLALFAAGWIACWKRGLVIPCVVVPLYVGLYLVWPFNQQERFYLPLHPLLVALLGFGVVPVARLALAALERPAGRWATAAAFAVAAVLLAARRSADAAWFGRWSTEYLLVVAAASTAAAFALLFALLRGKRRLALVPRLPQLLSAGLVLYAAVHAAAFVRFRFATLPAEHRAFLAARKEDPVAGRWQDIKARPELFRLLEILEAEADPTDLIMSDIPKIIHVLTGLRTTPVRISSATGEVLLDTPHGRPRFLYYSREIPEVNRVFDAFTARVPLERIHEIPVLEEIGGADAQTVTSVVLYRVPR